MRVKNAIPLIACTVGSHASAPRNDQEQKHGGSAIVKTGVVPTTLTMKDPARIVIIVPALGEARADFTVIIDAGVMLISGVRGFGEGGVSC